MFFFNKPLQRGMPAGPLMAGIVTLAPAQGKLPEGTTSTPLKMVSGRGCSPTRRIKA